MSSLASLPIRYPSRVYPALAFALALGALSSTPSLPPLVLLLATLRLHAFVLIPWQDWSSGVSQVALVSLAVAIAHAGSSLHALSTPSTSLVVLACLSVITTTTAGAAVAAGYYLERSDPSALGRSIMFPAVWATVWAAVEYCSPIGQLTTWSPVAQLGGYAWLRQIGGQVAINWVVAAWAVVIADAAGAWMLGSNEEEDATSENLIDYADDEDGAPAVAAAPATPGANEMRAARQRSASRAPTTLLLAGLLLVLVVPSYVFSDLPPPVTAGPDVTPFRVACALPYRMKDGRPLGPPGLDDFIAESKTLQSSANIILWPENVLHFQLRNDRQEAFDKIRNETHRGVYIGVGFEEVVHEDSPDGFWKVGMRRNGLVLLGSEGVVYEYYKRHLVPTESFSMTPSSDKPSQFTMQLKHPSNYTAPAWAPAPNFTRPINITASICLDFTTSSSFADLPSRPALILGPARTWHKSIGLAMWEQAKARAEEQGAMVLWCDGGEGGVSGVAGRGMRAFRQVGPGSWTQTVSVPWPFDQRRTVFSVTGTIVWVAFVWAIVLVVGGTREAAGGVMRQLENREHGPVGALSKMVRDVRDAVANLGQQERRGEEQPLLG